MTNADPLPATVLSRKAIVYVRQSTQTQVQVHRESQRRQYDLVEDARRRGFRDVEVIDDDLGRSASGTVARPGFERLVASLCAGEVGAVLCFDASRLSRNGRDWHHLLELCGLVGARVIDPDGVYDPCRPNDRLLLGMKGSISEFELGILRSRMLDAARSKARRGELRIPVPIGYVWHREIGLGLDPDHRVQEVTRRIFQGFRELGSAGQVHLALKVEGVHFPRPSDGKRMTAFDWTPIRYRNVISLLKNRFYAGEYAYGKTVNRTEIVDGRARKTYGHHRPLQDCEILREGSSRGLPRLGGVRAQSKQLAANAYGRKDGAKSGRGGCALFGGLLACGRAAGGCVVYTGRSNQPVYRCTRGNTAIGANAVILLPSDGRGNSPPSTLSAKCTYRALPSSRNPWIILRVTSWTRRPGSRPRPISRCQTFLFPRFKAHVQAPPAPNVRKSHSSTEEVHHEIPNGCRGSSAGAVRLWIPVNTDRRGRRGVFPR